MKNLPKFSLSTLSLLIFSTYSFAGVVNPNYFYQDYLDFALNKGRFTAGKENILIPSKDGKKDIKLNVPMVDFSAANHTGKLKSELTNIGGSYAISAAHMIQSNRMI